MRKISVSLIASALFLSLMPQARAQEKPNSPSIIDEDCWDTHQNDPAVCVKDISKNVTTFGGSVVNWINQQTEDPANAKYTEAVSVVKITLYYLAVSVVTLDKLLKVHKAEVLKIRKLEEKTRRLEEKNTNLKAHLPRYYAGASGGYSSSFDGASASGNFTLRLGARFAGTEKRGFQYEVGAGYDNGVTLKHRLVFHTPLLGTRFQYRAGLETGIALTDSRNVIGASFLQGFGYRLGRFTPIVDVGVTIQKDGPDYKMGATVEGGVLFRF